VPRARGQFYEWKTKAGVTGYGVRFRHRGRRRLVTLGHSTDMSRGDAMTAMADLMADVRRGLWVPPEELEPAPEIREVPSFHEFASEWFAAQREEGGRAGRGLSERGEADLLWRLRDHILPHLADHRLDAITVEVVDRYRRAKAVEGRLSPSSINKMLTTLAAILEVAVEYGYIDRNPARGRRRRLRTARPRRTYLDQADHIAALLAAGGRLDTEGRSYPWRRALLATLVFSGVRIGEALDLRWRDVDLAGGRLRVRGTKTDAADRTVELLPALRDELAVYAASRRSRERDARVFTTERGGRVSESNVRQRTLAPAVERANETLVLQDRDPIPDGVTPHSLRRTFATLLVALGRDPAVVMRQMGHSTPHFTLGVYAGAMDWSEGERERLRALVQGRPIPAIVAVAPAPEEGDGATDASRQADAA
jgi:integrase